MLILNGTDLTDEVPAMGVTNGHHPRTIVKHPVEDTRTSLLVLAQTEVKELPPVLLLLLLHRPRCRRHLSLILNLNSQHFLNLPPRMYHQ